MSEKLQVAEQNLNALAENPYPGRGIVMGLNEAGDAALQVYWVMGRSEDSQNRVLVEEVDVVRTEAINPGKVARPELTLYNAMRIVSDNFTVHVVSNGKQTDTIIDGFGEGKSFATSLEAETYEPDEPNYTPRISGLVVPYHQPSIGGLAEYGLSVIRKRTESEEPVHGYFRGVLTEDGRGLGRCIHTYLGNNSPLPSFDSKPFEVPMAAGVDDTAEMFWNTLNADNRVALVVKSIHLATQSTEYRIINAHEESQV